MVLWALGDCYLAKSMPIKSKVGGKGPPDAFFHFIWSTKSFSRSPCSRFPLVIQSPEQLCSYSWLRSDWKIEYLTFHPLPYDKINGFQCAFSCAHQCFFVLIGKWRNDLKIFPFSSIRNLMGSNMSIVIAVIYNYVCVHTTGELQIYQTQLSVFFFIIF